MVLATPGEALAFVDRYGPVVSVAIAAALAGVTKERVYALIGHYARFRDVRFLGQRSVVLHEFREWMDSPGRRKFGPQGGAR